MDIFINYFMGPFIGVCKKTCDSGVPYLNSTGGGIDQDQPEYHCTPTCKALGNDWYINSAGTECQQNCSLTTRDLGNNEQQC